MTLTVHAGLKGVSRCVWAAFQQNRDRDDGTRLTVSEKKKSADLKRFAIRLRCRASVFDGAFTPKLTGIHSTSPTVYTVWLAVMFPATLVLVTSPRYVASLSSRNPTNADPVTTEVAGGDEEVSLSVISVKFTRLITSALLASAISPRVLIRCPNTLTVDLLTQTTMRVHAGTSRSMQCWL